jgi:uncharacterized protein (TIGR00251 family)
MTTLTVLVRPGSRRPGISVASDAVVEVRVSAPAHDGRANEAVRKALAAALARPQSSITLVRGQTARHKTFAIIGLSRDDVFARLATQTK